MLIWFIKNATLAFKLLALIIWNKHLAGQLSIMASRKMVEEENQIVENAKRKKVVFLVAGTPLFATTHSDLIIRAKAESISVRIIHNISIMNVKGCFGLFSYNYGRTVSIPYFHGSYRPASFYDYLLINKSVGMHTLCLLDIKTDEDKFMTANEAINQLMEIEEEKKRGAISDEMEILVVCRFATESEFVVFDKVKKLREMEFGPPLHSLIIPGGMTEIEREFLEDMLRN